MFILILSWVCFLNNRQSTYDPDHTELHPPRPRSASSMHATSVERRPPKKKALLAKRASVDDIATYSVDVPDGEVQRNVKPILCLVSSVNI